MRTSSSVGLGFLALAIFVGYMMYEPYPPEIEEQWKVRLFSAATKILAVATKVMQYLGYNDSEIIQAIRRKVNHSYKIKTLEDDNLMMYDTEFDSVKVRVYRPKFSKKNLPGLVFYHGGGWTWLSIDSHHDFVKRLSFEANIVIVSVEYRLAPEHPFPIPLDDCLTATKYFIRNAEKYGADSTRIGVSGDSAGGNLAAAVSQALAKGPTEFAVINHQILIYPILQAFDFKTSSKINHTDYVLPFLSTRACAKYWLLYYKGVGVLDRIDDLLANRHISKDLLNSKYAEYVSHELLPAKYQFDRLADDHFKPEVDTEFSEDFGKILTNESYAPLMADDLSDLPPTMIITAEFDPLRDDGLMYAKRLDDAGVTVNLYQVKGGFHGYITAGFVTFKLLDNTMDEIVHFLESAHGSEN